ncbi:MAG: DUF4157 domain-containing protein [Spirirestis rafaelensis WJT71-NPBG6]|jgi:hypothetical protein|nr:DUF4157 domain-containing protein [Spirirestis rafaelensis WJT71-NPBG6]
MSDRTMDKRQHKGTSTVASPSLVSPNTPTLANPTPSFGLLTNNPPIPAVTEVSTDLQQAQPAGEQSLELPAIKEKPLGHDISRISLRRPQAKLTFGEPGDKYEQEADIIANRVMSMSDSAVQREAMSEEEESLQNKFINISIQRNILLDEVQTKPLLQRATDGSLQAGSSLERQLTSSKGGGSPLANEVHSFMEPRFGTDFSQVRVHTDGAAIQMNNELGAQAFTNGKDVYFGALKSPGNNELTTHELTHVVHQTSGVHRKLDSESQAQKFDQSVTNAKADQPEIGTEVTNALPNKAHPSSFLRTEPAHPVDLKQDVSSVQPSLPALPVVADSTPLNQAYSEATHSSNSTSENTSNLGNELTIGAEPSNDPHHGEVANELADVYAHEKPSEVADLHQPIPEVAGDSAHLDKGSDQSSEGIAEAEPPQELLQIPQPAMPESPDLAQAAQQIMQTKEAEKAVLAQTVEAQRNLLLQQTETQVKAIEATTQGKIQALTGEIEAKKAGVQQTFSATKAALKGQIENHKTSTQAEATRALNALQQDVETKRKTANTTAENEAKQVEQTGQTEATRASTSTAESAARVNAIAKQQGDRSGSKPEEKTAARQATGQAAAEVVSKLTPRGQSLAKDARESAQKAAQEFRTAGQKLAAGVGNNTSQVEKAIRDNTKATTNQIVTQITQQLQKIDALQTKALSSFENLKSSSISGIKQAGNSAAVAAKKSGKTAATQVSQFKVASLNQLDKGAHQVVEKLNQVPKNKKIDNKAVDKFVQETKEPFQQARMQLGTALSSQVSSAHSSLNQLGGSVSSHLDNLKQKVTGEANKAVSSLNTGLTQVPGQTDQQTQQAITGSKNANQQLISQFGEGIQQKIDEAKQGWVQQQQKVHSEIRSKVDEGIKSNKDVESKAPGDLAQVAQTAAAKASDPKWLQVLKGIGEGILKVLEGLAIFVAVVALVILLLPEGIVAAIGIAGVAALVGLGFLVYGFVTSFINRCKEFAQALHAAGVDDPPWYIYLAAGVAIPFVSLLDTVGVSPILEGALNRSILTGENLNLTPEQQAEKITEGVLTFALMFIMGRVLKGLGKPGKVPAGEVKPGEVKPGEVKPGEVKPGEVKPGEVKPGEAKLGSKTNADRLIVELGEERANKLVDDLTPDVVNKLLKDLTPSEIQDFVSQLSSSEKVKFLTEKYGSEALKHYGSDFFKNYEGVTQDTINHLLQNDGIVKGEIKGCHDQATFLNELNGKGEVVSEIPDPSNPDVVRYEYKLYQKDAAGKIKQPPTLSIGKAKLKTVIKDLANNPDKWKDIGNAAADDAIKRKEFPKDGGSFEGNGKGINIRGFYRPNKVDTFFPNF